MAFTEVTIARNGQIVAEGTVGSNQAWPCVATERPKIAVWQLPDSQAASTAFLHVEFQEDTPQGPNTKQQVIIDRGVERIYTFQSDGNEVELNIRLHV